MEGSEIDSSSDSSTYRTDNEFDDLEDISRYHSSRITLREHAAAVLGFSIPHSCSRQGVNDLLKLIQLHLPEKNRAAKSYASRRLNCNGWEKGSIKAIEYCELFFFIWPEDQPLIYQCQTNSCPG